MSGARMCVALFVLGLLAVAALSIAAHNMAYFPGDIGIARAAQAYQANWVETLTFAVSWPGYPPQSNIIFGSILVLLVVLGKRWAAVGEVVAAVGSGGSYFFLQQLVGRPRPTDDLIHVAGPLPMSGFPSGHLATFTAVFGLLAVVGYRALRPSPARWLPVGCVVVFLTLLSFARIYAGQHWPSDVLAGCLVGGLWAAAGSLYVLAEERFSRSRSIGVRASKRRYFSTASTRR
jgi:undecaprenyl-diphosphatase